MEKVCITGISGYIAGHIASLLLSRGYEVHGTVRSLKNKTRLQHLYDLETKNPNGKLVLYEADLTKEGSFDEAIKDCTYVLHVASPVETVTTKDPMESIVKPAVEGTLNVLRTCSRTPSVKRVVMTSSIWSITVWCEDRGKNYTFSDKDWNTLATANETPYAFSKKRAEEAAWEYVKNQKAFDLVTIIPGAMMGPLSSGDSAQPTPIALLIQMVSGKLLTMPKLPLYLVDVRDAALAHVKAMELSHCGNKRYLCVTEPDIWVSEAAVFAKKHYPNSPIITYPAPNWLFTLIPYWLAAKSEAILYAKRNSGKRFVFDVERTKKDLGITFTDPEITVKDTVESLISFGLLPKSYPLGAINVYVVGILLVVSLLIVYFVL